MTEHAQIAAELHDEALQQLSAVAQDLQAVSEGDAAALAFAQRGVERAICELRRIIDGTPTQTFQPGSLGQALRTCAQTLARGLPVEISVGDPELAPDVEAVVFLVARELLINAIKHAEARRVSIRIDVNTAGVLLEIRDDGVGMTTTAPSVGHGLGLVHQRVRAANGSVELTSSPGLGTQIRIVFPV